MEALAIQPTAEQTARDIAARETESVETKAHAVQVTDAAGYESATGILVELKRAEKRVESQRKELVDPLNATVRRLNDIFRPFADRIERARAALDGKMRAWRAEQDRKAEADRRWAEEQRRKAEAEEAAKRAAAEKAAREQEEARRRAEQAKRDAEEAQRQGNAAAKAKAEAARKAAELMAAAKAREAQAAIAAQEKAAKDQLAAQAVAAAATLDAPATTVSASGGRVTARKRWTFEITDAAKVPREWCVPDTKAIGQAVRAKNGVREIPGVRIYEVEDLATGTN